MASDSASVPADDKKTRTLDEVIAETVQDPEALEIVFTAKRQVACTGIGGALGHPKVFYTIGEKGFAECMYCDRVFVFNPDRAGEVLAEPGTAALTNEAS